MRKLSFENVHGEVSGNENSKWKTSTKNLTVQPNFLFLDSYVTAYDRV